MGNNWRRLFQQLRRLDPEGAGDALDLRETRIGTTTRLEMIPCLATLQPGGLGGFLLREAEALAKPLNLRVVEGHCFQNGNRHAETLAYASRRVYPLLTTCLPCVYKQAVTPRRGAVVATVNGRWRKGMAQTIQKRGNASASRLRVGAIIGHDVMYGRVLAIFGDDSEAVIVFRNLGHGTDWCEMKGEFGCCCAREATVLEDAVDLPNISPVARAAMDLAQQLAGLADSIGLAASATTDDEFAEAEKCVERAVDLLWNFARWQLGTIPKADDALAMALEAEA
jgi:hypothetical protein